MAAQHLLFEEDGIFRAGTVLSATDAAYQVELASGKRTKVKTGHVLLRFSSPSPAQLLERAQAEAAAMDLDFLWECSPQEEFAFGDLAREYHGHDPSAIEAAAILLRLHGAPVYFHRKGRGRFRPAAPDILRVALAAVERKRNQEQLRQQYVEQLKDGRLPQAIAALGIALAMQPDRNSVESKALEQAAAELHMSPLRLLLARGAIASPLRWHVDSFLAQAFPHGTGFAPGLAPPGDAEQLPLADASAFSIDDSSTTEIDDALSVEFLADGARVGIHIAAPALMIARGDAIDALARARMSTVYAPGLKITMLPPQWIAAFSLDAGREVPVLSLYLELAGAELTVVSSRTVVERIRIAANLRHDQLDQAVTPALLDGGGGDLRFGRELALLWQFARRRLRARELVRGRPEPLGRVDYSIALDGPAQGGGADGGEVSAADGGEVGGGDGGEGGRADGGGGDAGDGIRVRIQARQRGAPLDLIVAEMMILANSHWGGWLAQRGRAAIYRSQNRAVALGRVRMSTTPAPHDGMGVDHYAWSTSPLRRYVDLLNQRQLIATARNQPAPYGSHDAELFATVSGFEAAYTSYAAFQERLERYWCLRWLRQEGLTRLGATVIKADLIRLEGLPWVGRMPGLPELPRGQRILVDILGTDEVDLTIELRLAEVTRTRQPDAELADDEATAEEAAADADATADQAAADEAIVEEAAAAQDAADKTRADDPVQPLSTSPLPLAGEGQGDGDSVAPLATLTPGPSPARGRGEG